MEMQLNREKQSFEKELETKDEEFESAKTDYSRKVESFSCLSFLLVRVEISTIIVVAWWDLGQADVNICAPSTVGLIWRPLLHVFSYKKLKTGDSPPVS